MDCPLLSGVQKDICVVFGAEQLKSLSELRLPFRLVFDHLKEDRAPRNHGYERVCQKSLHVTNNESPKLSCIPSPSSNENATKIFIYLKLVMGTFWILPSWPNADSVTPCNWLPLILLSATQSRAAFFSILRQPDGRILMQSKQSGKFLRAKDLRVSPKGGKVPHFENFPPFLPPFCIFPHSSPICYFVIFIHEITLK